MIEKICKNCLYWTRSPISDGLIEIDEIGNCEGLNGVYSVEILENDEHIEEPEILTDYDFYCKNHKRK